MKMMSEVIKLVMEKIALSDGYRKNWIESHWNEVVGAVAGTHCAPKKMSNGILFVKVDSSAWTYNLFTKRKDFLRIINELYGCSIVTDIKYQVGDFEAEQAENSRKQEIVRMEKNNDRYKSDLEQRILACMKQKKNSGKIEK